MNVLQLVPILFFSLAVTIYPELSRLQSSRPESAPESFDCASRELAWKYAQQLQAWRGDNLQTVFDALELDTLCGTKYDPRINRELQGKQGNNLPGVIRKRSPMDTTFYVDGYSGSNSNPGTFEKPFKTIEYAVSQTRSISGPKSILIRKGTYYLSETLHLYSIDSMLTIASYNYEDVEISGGIPLVTKWTPYKVTAKPTLEEYTGSNNVYGRLSFPKQNTTTLRFLGNFNVIDECRDACSTYKENQSSICYSYTFHLPSIGNEWAKGCYGDITQTWGPNPNQNVVSGRWVQYNIYMADLSDQNIDSILGLQLVNAGGRVTRARYPNADVETSFFPDGWIHETDSWAPPYPFPPADTILTEEPQRTDIAMFQKYTVGVGGPCSIFSPPESYWCSKYNDGGGPGLFETPQGLTYKEGTFLDTKFGSGQGMVAHVWHSYHWAMWMYLIDSMDPNSRNIKWRYGGFQGARGSVLTHGGSEWYLENAIELLDSPNEYYYDENTHQLYFFFNGTTPPPQKIQFMATHLKNIIEVSATKNEPAIGITFSGIRFTGGAYTYLDPHGVPSGGDWAMQRMGALFFEGTEQLVIQDCTFLRLDGIAIMLSGYNRDAVIQRNEFAWTGESAIAAWGYTNGIDGTDGNQPRGTQLLYNLIREIGMYQKQSSGWFQAKSCQNYLKGNIIFNGPRALININDGFGGGTVISDNLLFNANRETSDQGPFNSWDRQPFLTEVLNGTASLTPAYNEIHHNFFFCNYGSNMCIDNDDGSSYYLLHHNFEVYGGHKSDFGGHNKYTYNSINAYSKVYGDGLCCDIETQPPNFVPGYVDGYYNNTCIQSPTAPYFSHSGCDPNNINPATLSISHDNTVYNANGKATVKCGNKEFSESEWQSLGFDVRTIAYTLPTDEQIINWARDLLGINLTIVS